MFIYNNVEYDEAAAIARLNRIQNLRTRSSIIRNMQDTNLGRVILRIIEIVSCGCCSFRGYTPDNYDWLDDYQFLQRMQQAPVLNNHVIGVYQRAIRHYNAYNPGRYIALSYPVAYAPPSSYRPNTRALVNDRIAASAAAQRHTSPPPPAPARTPSTFLPYNPAPRPSEREGAPVPPPRAAVGVGGNDGHLPRSRPIGASGHAAMARAATGDRADGARPAPAAAPAGRVSAPAFMPPPQPQQPPAGGAQNGRAVIGARAEKR